MCICMYVFCLNAYTCRYVDLNRNEAKDREVSYPTASMYSIKHVENTEHRDNLSVHDHIYKLTG